MGRPAGWMTGVDGTVADEVAGGAGVIGGRSSASSGGRSPRGCSTEEAARAVGVSQAVGGRWFRHGGGMPPFDLVAAVGPVSVVRGAGGDRAA